MAGVSAAMIGYLAAKTNMFERLLLLAGGLMLIDPRLMTDAAGIGIPCLCPLYAVPEKKESGCIISTVQSLHTKPQYVLRVFVYLI